MDFFPLSHVTPVSYYEAGSTLQNLSIHVNAC